MDISVAGCCNNYGGPDFSKMDFKKLEALCLVSHVNWCDRNLWFSAAAIFCLPIFCCMIHSLRWCPLPFLSCRTFVEMMGFALNILKLFKFHEMIKSQPQWEVLQQGMVVFAAYQLLGVGIILYITALAGFGLWGTFCHLGLIESRAEPRTPQKGVSRSKQRRSAQIPRRYCDLSKMLKTGSFCCYLAYSLMYASQAGVLVTVLQALVHCYGLTPL